MFVAIDSGSVGYQIGGSSTDIVMLFMNDHALQSLMSDKFKLGQTLLWRPDPWAGMPQRALTLI